MAKGIRDLPIWVSCPEKEVSCPLLPFSPFPLAGSWTQGMWWCAVFNIEGPGQATAWEECGSPTHKGSDRLPRLVVRNFHFV